jgi:hypothetical protein
VHPAAPHAGFPGILARPLAVEFAFLPCLLCAARFFRFQIPACRNPRQNFLTRLPPMLMYGAEAGNMESKAAFVCRENARLPRQSFFSHFPEIQG